ncbi:hypothetical protein CL655_04125 [bacterium]|nr:hypothetical protein [bacterium]|tara:strand:- start:392 stop:1204 length:813 start_codon:yes stop_codon:yes gene_type:complete
MNEKKDICNGVMERIKAGEVCPRSRGWFTCLECFVWMFWLAAVVVGALAIGILFYTTISGWFGFHEAKAMSRLGMVLAYVPVVWVAILILTVVLAYRNVRHTKRGYRYPVWLILISSIGTSFIGGLVFFAIGFGFFVDTKLGEEMSRYASYYKQQELFWQAPTENRWLGTVAVEGDMVFADANGAHWELNTAELTEPELQLLMDGQQVKLLGVSDDMQAINVCGVFPWYEAKPLMPKELARERGVLLERLAYHKRASSTCSRMGVLEHMP